MLNNDATKSLTNEGGVQYDTSFDSALDFFSKAGSLFEKRQNFYQNSEDILSLFQKAWVVDKEIAFKLLLWLRDIRCGAGNRSGFRNCIHWVAKNDPEWVKLNIGWIPEIGRFDDLRTFFGTPVEQEALNVWAYNIIQENILAAKWANRKDAPLRKILGFDNEAGFRKFLAKMRKNHIVEHKMSQKMWSEINYKNVPSVAMARYTNAFQKNDTERFEKYKEALKSGKETINARALFPHDCVRTAISGDSEITNAQFDALPNYMDGVDERIIVISDTSGSMDVRVSGSISAWHVSVGMALYCSAKISPDNPFYKKFIGFCSEGSFKDWNGMTFSQAVGSRKIFDGAIGSTRIDKALNLILDTAKFFKLTNDQIPTTLLIISDMQFHNGGVVGDDTEVNKCMKLWKESGYNIPKIIYWNTNGYAGSPSDAFTKNTALVSGFGPTILKSIFSAEDLSPKSVMLKTLEKYNIEIPKQ